MTSWDLGSQMQQISRNMCKSVSREVELKWGTHLNIGGNISWVGGGDLQLEKKRKQMLLQYPLFLPWIPCDQLAHTLIPVPLLIRLNFALKTQAKISLSFIKLFLSRILSL